MVLHNPGPQPGQHEREEPAGIPERGPGASREAPGGGSGRRDSDGAAGERLRTRGGSSLCPKKYLKIVGSGCSMGGMAMPGKQPVELHAYAMDNLRYIRDTIERAGSFTAVPGAGGIAMAVSALAAAWVAHTASASGQGSGRWLAVWLVEAVLAMGIGILAAARKSKRAGQPVLSGPGRKFLAGFAPAMLAGAVLTAALYSGGGTSYLPGMWLLLYGAAVLSAGGASVRIVPLMGLCFMAAGTVALLLPPAWGDVALAAGFGGIHMLFGTIIAVNYGG